LIDDIYKRTQDALWIHLNAGQHDRDGHLLIVGAPGSGKTTLIRTLAMSLALLHSPDRLHMYFLSLTGSGLNDLGELPHAERVVQGTETERVRRLLGRLLHSLNERQAGRAQSFEPTMVLFIDAYEPFRDSFYEKHVADFERLIQEGRAVGIYLVVTSSTVGAIPERVRSLIPQRIALQLGNTADYTAAIGAIQMRLEGRLARGRGFVAGQQPLMCQIALPSREAKMAEEENSYTLHELGGEMRAHWRGKTPAPIRELPARIPFQADQSSLEPGENCLQTLIGQCDDDALSTYTLDWEESGPHFVVIGPAGSGKTNLLHLVVLSAARLYSPEQVRFLLVDFNGRSLRALDGLQHVIARVSEWTGLQEAIGHLSAELEAFYAQWRDNPQAVFPKTVIVIDDYDMTAEILGAHGPLLQQLRDLARLYSEQGLHLWAAGYLERANDPLIRQLLLRRSGFGLSVRESLHPLNVRTAGLPNEVMPEGRAYFVEHHVLRVIQTLWVENTGEQVREINDVWKEKARAAWVYPRSEVGETPKLIAQTPDDLTIDTDGLLRDLMGDDFEP
jgi:S-DNA-T family DNA segregation ATPase FtsK/SpoIIIE